MSPIKIITSTYLFRATRKCGLLLLLIGVSVTTCAQLHISGNTLVSVKENTVVYVSGESTEQSSATVQTVKVYVGQGTLLSSVTSDPLIEIIYLKKKPELKEQSKEIQLEKKINNAVKLIVKTENNESHKEKESLTVFIPEGRSPLASFGCENGLNAVFVCSGSFFVKSFQTKSHIRNIAYLFNFFFDNRSIHAYSQDHFRKFQHILQEHITRPPPFQV